MALSDEVIAALLHGQVKGAILLGADLAELIGTAVMAGSLPVTIASDDTLVTAIKTALELLDNAISGTEMQVDVASLPVGTAAMAASTPVTIASNDTLITAIKTAVELIDNAISGTEMQVDVANVQLDDTDKLAVSLYGKGSAAGDSELLVESAVQHNLRTSIYSGANLVTTDHAGGAGRPSALMMLRVVAAPMLYNGASLDAQLNNIAKTLLASAARTAETSSADQVNYNGRGLIVYVDWTVETDTVTLTPRLQVKDSIGGGYHTVWSAAADLAAIGDAVYLFQVGIVAAAAGSFTEAVNLRVGRNWRFQMGVGDTDEATYSVSCEELV